MARNEEKQLARLNRYYLEKQKQEEQKKRPPRPRLDTLNTPREVRKWLPTITRDIEFYVKQMEVTCYTDSKIEEFKDRIQRLKQEYRAYQHKLRALEPDVNTASWSDRPYTNRKRPANSLATQEGDDEGSTEGPKVAALTSSSSQNGEGRSPHFTPISTPVLQRMSVGVVQETIAPPVWNVNPDTQDVPLQFANSSPLAVGYRQSTTASSENQDSYHPDRGSLPAKGTPASSLTSSHQAVSHGERCPYSGFGTPSAQTNTTQTGSISKTASDGVEMPTGSCGNVTGCLRNKAVSIGPTSRDITSDHSPQWSSSQNLPHPAGKGELPYDSSSLKDRTNAQNEHPATSNPLNLGYSDSSDEDEG